MGFSRVASLHLVPLVARLVLCAVFVPVGWNKIMTSGTFTGEEATTIRRLTGQSEAAPPVTPDADGDAGDASTDTNASTATEPTSSGSPSIEARRVYGLAAMLDNAGVRFPVLAAWVAAVVELVGGGLLLVGLFSRIWGLGLAIAMGVAFALTSWPVISEAGPFALEISHINKTAAQLALGALAFGVLLGGPGAISIDHGIFGRRKHDAEEEAWDQEES